MRKKVVGMKKADYIAGGERNALVQGIIDASVRLADKSRQPFATLFDDFLGAVSGRTVDDNMLHVLVCLHGCRTKAVGHGIGGIVSRSEEHTSELQSLMRISYAVFCLKKKKKKNKTRKIMTPNENTKKSHEHMK